MVDVLGWLAESPLLALMVVIALGFVVGRVKIGSFSLGVSAVLFIGLGLSALEPALELPKFVYLLGLTLFVYTIGLSSGTAFFRSLKDKGIKLNILALVIILLSAAEIAVLVVLFHLDPFQAAGVFTGSLTNTPALAAVVNAAPGVADGDAAAALSPVVGYSLAYPLGVLLCIVAMAILQKVWKINHHQEAIDAGVEAKPLRSRTVLITRTTPLKASEIPVLVGAPVLAARVLSNPRHHDSDQPLLAAERAGLVERTEVGALNGAVVGGGQTMIATEDTEIHEGDVVSLVAEDGVVDEAVRALGEPIALDLASYDHSVDYRRIVVSNPEMVGVPLGTLGLQRKHGILITRIRRGDEDHVATDKASLELGDRVRVVCRRDRISTASRMLGDSYHSLSEIDVLTFSVGIALGLLVGLIPLPIPGLGTFELGSAGGPLVVALILGALGRTGPIFWRIPYSANLTIRQIGIVLFLGAIGTAAGPALAKALSNPASLGLIGAGALSTATVAILGLVVIHKVFRLPFGQAMGVVGGIQTQPALLAYANEQTGNELSSMGYSTVYPMAMISKIIVAQLLLLVVVAL